jgi:hypothetical protein
MINEIIRGIVADVIPELGECLPLGHVSCIAPGAVPKFLIEEL